MASSFLSPGPVAHEGALASLHLRRDLSLPILLSNAASAAEDEGYAEGRVTNTRFGSFPHSTIIGTPWGSQIRASKVDTGSRGRDQNHGKKRKAKNITGAKDEDEAATKEAETASSGFLHVLHPTPESWTYSLPHRTQVVYTPDYSYILYRIRARPGTILIEAGSGSGSFTHAAARAVFSGYPGDLANGDSLSTPTNYGKVYSYEYHSERHDKVRKEMEVHGLSSIVTASHHDVYKDGFLLSHSDPETPSKSPAASSIFLDLPAPWSALPHLTRTDPSPLDPSLPVSLCTFSPCIEQVQKTVSHLRRYNWIDIETVEVSNHRIDVRREYTGYEYDGMRGVNPFAATVDSAVEKLKEVESRAQNFHAGSQNKSDGTTPKKTTRFQNTQSYANKILFREGQLIHRTEPEMKTHTSYLVFAVLPREWTAEDEEREREKWSKPIRLESDAPKSQRQLKKESKLRKKINQARRGDAMTGRAGQNDIEGEVESNNEEDQEDVEMEV